MTKEDDTTSVLGDTAATNREALRLEAIERSREAARPVLADLAAIGIEIQALADLPGRGNYREAIPVLVKWLPQIEDVAIKTGIVRALTVPWATAAVPMLVREFRREGEVPPSLRWAIGNALEVLASDQIADEMMQIAVDQRYGTARQMVVLGLGKLKNPRVVDVLLGLLQDEDVVGHAVDALGALRAQQARGRLEQLLSHPKAWVRKEAKKALAKIDKAGRR